MISVQSQIYKIVVIAFALTTISCKHETTRRSSEDVVDTVKTNNDVTDVCENYKEIDFPTTKYDHDNVNNVRGVILHHTAEPTVERSLNILTSKEKSVSTHIVIDTDGTRYILATPDMITYHAGYSILGNMEGCNNFTIGVEFQGNTLEEPLTDDQIASGIEYLQPIIAKYKIPLENIVTHEMVRTAYKQKHPNKRCSGKVDITQTEYVRFMKALNTTIELRAKTQ